jgi:hypothetical protein
MFTKIHLAFYNALFDFYGKLIEYYIHMMKVDENNIDYWDQKACRCIEKREDILDIMFTLKGLS